MLNRHSNPGKLGFQHMVTYRPSHWWRISPRLEHRHDSPCIGSRRSSLYCCRRYRRCFYRQSASQVLRHSQFLSKSHCEAILEVRPHILLPSKLSRYGAECMWPADYQMLPRQWDKCSHRRRCYWLGCWGETMSSLFQWLSMGSHPGMNMQDLAYSMKLRPHLSSKHRSTVQKFTQ